MRSFLAFFKKELTEAYKNENFKRMKDFKNALARIGIDSLKIEAGKPYIVKLRKFFEERKRR